MLPRRTGVHAHTLKGYPGRSSVSVSLSSSLAVAMSARAKSARGLVASPETRSGSSRARILHRMRGCVKGHNYNQLVCLGRRVHDNSYSRRKRYHYCRRFCHSPCSLKTLRAGVDDNTDGDARAGDVRSIFTGTERALTPAGVPIPLSPSPPPPQSFSPHPPGDLNMAPPTIVSRTTD